MSTQHLTIIRGAIFIMLRDSPSELAIIDQLQAIIDQAKTKLLFRQTTKYKKPSSTGRKR